MRNALIGLGVVLVLVAALNHYVLKQNPIAHTSIILGVVGVLVALVGVGMMFMVRGKAA